MWHHGNTVHGQLSVGLSTNKVAHSGQNVESRHVLLDSVGLEPLGVRDEHGHTDRALKVAHLVPQTALAKHITVVATEHDDGVFVQLAVLERLQKLADAVIDKAAGSIVRSPRLLDLLIAEVLVPEIAHLQQSLAVGVLFLPGDLDLGKFNVNTLIAIPELLLGGVGIMGVSERDLSATLMLARVLLTCHSFRTVFGPSAGVHIFFFFFNVPSNRMGGHRFA